MTEQLYSVYDDSEKVLACHMDLRNALIFIQAMMIEYFMEPNLTYSIRREQNECEEVQHG